MYLLPVNRWTLSSSNFAASSADVQRRFRVAAFHGLARFFRAACRRRESFVYDFRRSRRERNFRWSIFDGILLFRDLQRCGDQVRYCAGEVLPATSDLARFLFFQTDWISKNVTVLCFDFCDYETFVLLFPLLCVWANQSKLWGGAGNYA